MKDIRSISKEMTLEEKAALCTGANMWSTAAMERVGIPAMFFSDGPHGLRRMVDIEAIGRNSLPATCFPTASCLAATWDVELAYQMGEALAEECIAQNVDVLLGPGVNMKRSPLCGRNFEYLSEDPFLAGEMAAGIIQGIQGRGVGSSLKHFAANNQEFQRLCISSEVDERTLREIYLPAFEKAVRQAKPWMVMCAYNKLNGTYCAEHRSLLTDILRKEWGYEGLVVSDWYAVHDRVASLRGGLDLEMPGPQERRVKSVVDAVRSGRLEEAVLDESVRRILTVVRKAGETPKGGAFDAEAHHALARKIASEAIVLLKNNGILPLKDVRHVAVIGRSAENPYYQGRGSSHVHPTKVDVPFQELQNRAGDAEVAFAEGYPADHASRKDLIEEAASLARTADVALLFVAPRPFEESEGYDRAWLDLSEQQVALIRSVAKAQPNTVVVLNSGSPIAMRAWIDDVAAVLEGWMMGQAGGAALADVLFGKVNPSGKLAETFPVKLSDTPAHINWPGGNGEVRYGEGIFIGYRYYDARETPVQFPFGHGLSYTSFAYSNLRVSAKLFKDADGLDVSVDVANTGPIAGRETVQVYVHDRVSGLVRPPKELKGFSKVEIPPGQTKTVTVHLDFRAFAYYHPRYRRWVAEDGEFDILVGASAADIRCRQTVTLQSTIDLPCVLDRESTLREWMADPRGKAVLGTLLEQIIERNRKAFGSPDREDTAGGGSMSVEPTRMIMDTPLDSVLRIQQSMLPMNADDMVDDLLQKVHGLDG